MSQNPMPETVNIDDKVALREQIELCEFYRNRNLVLAQAFAQIRGVAANLKKQVDEQAAEISRLQGEPEPTTTAEE